MNRLSHLRAQFAAELERSALWARWQVMPRRDRQLLKVLAVAVGLLLFYAFIWLPLDRKLESARDRFEQERELHAYLREQAPNISGGARSERTILSSEQLQGVVTSTAQQHALVLERLDSDGSERLLISLSKAPFEKIVQWIQELEKKGAVLHEVSLERRDIGKVDVRLAVGVGQ